MLALEQEVQIGQRIRDLREARAITQVELHELAEVDAITISNIERGKQKPSARTLRKLARALGVEVMELTSGTYSPSLPGGAKTEEHLDAVLDHEEELRQRRDAKKSNGEGNESGGSKT